MSIANTGTKITNKIQGYADAAVATPVAFLTRIMIAIAAFIAAAVILATFATYAGFRVPYIKQVGATELAYAVGALAIFNKFCR